MRNEKIRIVFFIICTLLLGGCSSQTAASDITPPEYTARVSEDPPIAAPSEPPQENAETDCPVYESDTVVGCFFIHTAEYEFFLSLPQQEEWVFRVLMYPEGQYGDPTEYDVDAARIFADTGCKAEVYGGMGTENNLPYKGTVCFVTATPERMWELGTELGDGKTGNLFFVEQQYDSVKQRFNTLVWTSEDA